MPLGGHSRGGHPRGAHEGAPEMDVVMVVTQGRARGDDLGWT